MGYLTEAEYAAKAAEFEELAQRTDFPDLADGFRLLAESYRTLARIAAKRARVAVDPLPPSG